MKGLHVTLLYLTFKRVIWPNLTQFNHFRIFEIDLTSETGLTQVIFLDILDFTFISDLYQKPSCRICWTQPLFRDNLLEIFEFFWTSKMTPTDEYWVRGRLLEPRYRNMQSLTFWNQVWVQPSCPIRSKTCKY